MPVRRIEVIEASRHDEKLDYIVGGFALLAVFIAVGLVLYYR